eukprot:838831-Pyramimonas_sp.AAC.1
MPMSSKSPANNWGRIEFSSGAGAALAKDAQPPGEGEGAGRGLLRTAGRARRAKPQAAQDGGALPAGNQEPIPSGEGEHTWRGSQSREERWDIPGVRANCTAKRVRLCPSAVVL